MKLLFVSLDFPFPANNGHRLRNWGLLRTLAAEGHEVTLLTFVHPGEPSGASLAVVREVCTQVITVPLELAKATGAENYTQGIRALFGQAPYSVQRFRSNAMKAHLNTLLSSRRFDATMCETCYPLVNFPSNLNLPLILDNHNLEHVLVQRYSQYEPSLARRTYAALEWRRMRSWERAAWKRASTVILCSEHDRKMCVNMSEGSVTSVVPNIVDVEDYPESKSDGSTLLYVGGMDWFPNRDAIQFFCFKVFPLLLERFPALKLVVAGRGPDDAFRSLFKGMNVTFTGTIPEMRPVIAAGTICIVPLRIGSGTRLKILEAAAMGKPIVSTSVGAEGLNFVPRREILLADTAQAFVDSITELLVSPGLGSSLGAAARARVESEYSMRAMRAALSAALKEIPHGPGQPPADSEKQLWHSSTY